MATLVSPGVSVSFVNESFYASTGQGTIPLIVLATATNKSSPTAGAGIAPYTLAANAGKLYLATSQRDLIQNFGNPLFYSSTGGTPLHGYELNEYGLWTAYSYLGIANQCYVLRADLDLSELIASSSEPAGAPVAGTYWFDLTNTRWGVFRANGKTSPGAAWDAVSVLVALEANVDEDDVPVSGFGSTGNICVVPINAANLFYEKFSTGWLLIGSPAWKSKYDTVIVGTATSASLTQGHTFVLNGTTVTITDSGASIADVRDDINSASISNISADLTSGKLRITNTAGGNITLAAGSGSPLTTLGLSIGTTLGVSVVRNNNATYPSGAVAHSLWIKGNPANQGANWSVKYYNATLGTWVTLTAPFYAFDSTADDVADAPAKDAAAVAALGSPAVGTVYVGYDTTEGNQELRRWNGSRWVSLAGYEADTAAPTTTPAADTLWYNTNFFADIMVGNGSNWIGYRRQFPNSDINGVQIAGSAPTTQSRPAYALVEGDLWLDSSDLENYPALYRYNATASTWDLIDNTDQTTPYGIVFADARATSGPTFEGIPNEDDYAYNSTAAVDLAISDYVDPDAPDPRTFPAGTLLFNTRRSTYNVKGWKPTYFKAGGFDANTDFTLDTYTVGADGYEFPAVASAGRWVTRSGNRTDGSPYMGRKAQRAMVVTALQAAITANQDIRSEIVFFNLMAAPGYPELINECITLNTDMKQIAFCVADTPARLAPNGTAFQRWAANGANASTTGEDGLTVADEYVGVYYPWGIGTNLDGSEIMIPPSAIALATIAYNDQVAYPWYAPAGFNRGLVTNASSVGYLTSETEYAPVILNQGQRDVLYVNRINPIAYIPNRGLVVYGQKTLDTTSSALDRINVARLTNYIAYNLDNALKPFLFEQNTHLTRATVKATVERFFNQLVGLNGLYDFAVVCDGSNNTPARVDRNELWVDCAIQPVKAIEFIYVPVRILTTQAVA